MRYYTPPPLEPLASGLAYFFVHFIDSKGFPFYRIVAAMTEGDAVVAAVIADGHENSDPPSFVKAEKFPELEILVSVRPEDLLQKSVYLDRDGTPTEDPCKMFENACNHNGGVPYSWAARKHMGIVAQWLAHYGHDVDKLTWKQIAELLNSKGNHTVSKTISGTKWTDTGLSSAFYSAMGWNKKHLRGACERYRKRNDLPSLSTLKCSAVTPVL